MKLPKEFINGFIIFIGLSAYFFLMQILGLSNLHYLRFFNVFIVYLGIHRTLHSNFKEKELGYLPNLIAAAITATIGVLLSIIALVLFIYYKGGQLYLNQLSDGILFGGNPTVTEYIFGLLFEGIASSWVVVFLSMQFWQNKTKSGA
jgi:hypothetical protein